jgi:hypothetical protein
VPHAAHVRGARPPLESPLYRAGLLRVPAAQLRSGTMVREASA